MALPRLLFADAYFFCVLTPELSRHAERARRWDNLSASAETAKRARLERIVRRVTPMNSVCRDLQANAPG